MIENTFEGGINSELQVASTDRSDNGVFTCTAANAYGEDKRTVKLMVLGQYAIFKTFLLDISRISRPKRSATSVPQRQFGS